MEVLSKQSNLNKVTLDILLEYILKNCCNKQQQFEEIIVENNIDIEEIKVSAINFKEKLKSAEKPILFCPPFIKNFDYFKTNQDILIFNINSLDLNPTLSISSKKSSKDYDTNFKSLFLSILYCLNDKITDKLLEDFIINSNKYVQIVDLNKLNIKKIKLNKSLKSHKIDLDVIRFLSEYLHINIFIFDEKTYNNRIIYCSGDFVPYKKNIVLYLDKETDCYYPLITNKFKFFKFDQSIIKHILSDISILATHDKSDFKLLTENLDCYINKEVSLLIEENMKIDIKNEEETFKDNTSIINGFDDNYSPTEKDINYNSDEETNEDNDEEDDTKRKREEYLTYSLKDLQKLAKENNIDIKNKTGKFKTKKELIDGLV